MNFNSEECKVLHFGRGNPNYSYTMNGYAPAGTVLVSVSEEKDVGITELDNKQTEALVEDNIDQDKAIDDTKEDHKALKDEEPEVKFTEIEVRSREINIDVADTTLDVKHKEDDIDINDEDVSEPNVSPDSNKENESESKQNIIEMPRPALKERKKVVIQSRVSRIINLSSAKSDSGSPDTSPSILSPSSGRPWSKYKPSPSHASPSAGILKRKRGDDTPTSTEGSPLTGKIRHVHFKHDPVSERVEVPRSIERTAARKKLRLYNPDQDILSKESTTGMRTFEETPPLDVSTGPIYPALITCNIPVKDLVLQLAASVTSIKILERDFATFCLSTVGDLATLNAAQVRNLRGVKLPKELTVKRVLSSLAKTSLVKKSPVLEITSKEEEEKIKAALFHGPSPSPTSPPKNTFSANFNTSPEKPAKLIQFSSNSGKIGRNTDLWQEELDSEEPLSVRAKKAAAAALLSNKEADEIAAPSSNKEAAPSSNNEAAQLNSKEAALTRNKDANDIVEDDVKNIESNTKEATKAVSEPMESNGVNENQDKAPDGIKPSEKVKVAEIKKVTAATSVDLNNLDAIMTKAELEGMQSYSKADLMVILQKTVQKQQRLAEFMTSVTTALNKPEQS